MKKQREQVYDCPKCGNQRTKSNCSYCSWKGWEGPGKQLRDAIRSANEEKAMRS